MAEVISVRVIWLCSGFGDSCRKLQSQKYTLRVKKEYKDHFLRSDLRVAAVGWLETSHLIGVSRPRIVRCLTRIRALPHKDRDALSFLLWLLGTKNNRRKGALNARMSRGEAIVHGRKSAENMDMRPHGSAAREENLHACLRSPK
ncbi:hypothetical protein [Nitratireductor soli]|uniref:hypothetical protein n=1 Tax=Nitratireductor soli TaxID=1670619 RepID=UPI0012F9112C|nr:hypothetical protein [Nitratireductor soli]